MRIHLFIMLLVGVSSPNVYADNAEQMTVVGRDEHDAENTDNADVDTVKVADTPGPNLGLGRSLERGLGVRVQQTGGAGRGQTLQLRGANPHQVLILIDDIQLSGPRGEAIDITTLPIGCIDKIDVHRGPQGSRFGGGAQGGAIRIRYPNPNQGMRAELGLGSYGMFYGHGCATMGERSMGVQLSTRYSTAEDNFNFRDVNGRSQTRLNNDHERFGAAVRTHWKPYRGAKLSSLFDFSRDERGEPGSAQAPSMTARSEQLRLSSGLAYTDSSLLGGKLITKQTASHVKRTYDFDERSSSFGGLSEAFELDDDSIQLQSNAHFYPTNDWSFDTSAEVTWAQANTRSQGSQRREHRYLSALATGVGWSPIAQLDLRLSSRLDWRRGRDAIIAPNMSLRFRPTQRWVVHLEAGRHYRDPSFDELYFRGTGISGNPDLRAEDGTGASLNVRFHMKQAGVNMKVDGGLYMQRFDRIITFLPIDAFRVRASDELSAEIFGSESRLQLSWLDLRCETTYHYQRHEDGSGRPLPYRPVHRLNWMVAYEPLAWSIFVRGLEQSKVNSDRFGYRSLSGYQLFDAGVAIALGSVFKLSFEVRNLMNDQELYDVLHRPLPGRAAYVALGLTRPSKNNR